MFTRIILVITALCLSAMAFSQGVIRGKVIDEATGETLIGATVLIQGTTTGSTTDLDGAYAIGDLAPGTYRFECSYIGYERKLITEVQVAAKEVTVLNIRLGESAQQVEMVEITAKAVRNTENALLTIQRKATMILDGISSSQISKSGDSDAAGALQRVTGVSVEGGKYVYVRGLGDRYSKTALNGAELPGLDPNRNTVQMDLFPANLIDNLLIYKTCSPDLPGSFAGGYVNIETKDFPERFTLRFSNGLSFNTKTTFRKRVLSYEGGKGDWLATDDGTRSIQQEVEGADIPFFSQAQFNEDQADVLSAKTRAFPNNWNFQEKTPFFNHSHAFSVGNQGQLFGRPIGYVAGVSYRRSFAYYDDGHIGRYKLASRESIARKLSEDLELKDEKGSEEVLWGAMFNTNYRISPHHKVGIQLMYNQSGEQTARYQVGDKPSDDVSLHYQTRSLQYQQRLLDAFQLNGEHHLPGLAELRINWLSAYTISKQDQPDLRFFTNGFRKTNGDTTHKIEPSIGQLPTRYYRHMQETNFDNKLHLTIPFNQWSGLQAKLKTGGAFLRKDRQFREQQYRFDNQSQSFSGRVEQYFSSENTWDIGDGEGVFLIDAFDASNNYDAQQLVWAAYLMTELPLTQSLRLITGLRIEGTDIALNSFDEDLPTGELNEVDYLPSVNLNYSTSERSNLRAAYSRTLARPTFRELAPYASFDFIGDFVLIGNDSLQRTLVDNIDLRWELFPRSGEIISVSAFYKNFQNPIERAFNPVAANPELNYRNVGNGWLAGAELELRKNLGFLSPKLESLLFGANFTYVYSRVDIAADELEAIRALRPQAEPYREMFGQSPYLINAYLNYSHEKGTEVNLVFNLFGPRLAYIIVGGTPDVYERPRPSLDFSIKQQIAGHWQVKISATNLINPAHKKAYAFKTLEYPYESYRMGRTFGIGVTYQIN